MGQTNEARQYAVTGDPQAAHLIGRLLGCVRLALGDRQKRHGGNGALARVEQGPGIACITQTLA